jgi:hypothetical protein
VERNWAELRAHGGTPRRRQDRQEGRRGRSGDPTVWPMRARLTLLSAAAIALACGANPSSMANAPGDAAAVPSLPGPAVAASAELVVERLDPDGSCDAIVPAVVPAPVDARSDGAGGTACLAATSDGDGAVALACADPAGAVTVQTFGPDGAARGAAPAEGLTALVPQPRGFHALASAGGEARFLVVAADGTLARSEPVAPAELGLVDARLAPDPAGGGVVVARGTHESGNHWFELLAARRDGAGAPVSEARITNGSDPTAPMFFAGAVNASGATFAVWGERGTTRVAWLGRDGALGAEPADDGATADHGLDFGTPIELAALLDGTVALRAGTMWRRAWAPSATTGAAPPAWLAERPGTRVRTVRGGTAYALVPDAAAGVCAQGVELLSSEGRICGAVTVTESTSECGASVLEVGRDGTLLREAAGAVRFWPGLLR